MKPGLTSAPAPFSLASQSVLLIGAGSIGRRHALNLKSRGLGRLTILDSDSAAASRLAQDAEAEVVLSLEAGLETSPHAVFICTPPATHAAYAQTALEQGCHVFIEKPLAATLDQARQLRQLAARSDRVVQVGYCLRFHPGVSELKRAMAADEIGDILWGHIEFGFFLPDWRKHADFRANYSLRAEQGGGIVLDASHELDYLLWLLPSPRALVATTAQVGPWRSDTEDSASALILYERNVHISVHMDYLQRAYSRSCKFVGEHGTLAWQLRRPYVEFWGPGCETPSQRPFTFEPNQMYLAELDHFFTCIETGATPLNSLASAYESLRLAAAMLESAASRHWVSLA